MVVCWHKSGGVVCAVGMQLGGCGVGIWCGGCAVRMRRGGCVEELWLDGCAVGMGHSGGFGTVDVGGLGAWWGCGTVDVRWGCGIWVLTDAVG